MIRWSYAYSDDWTVVYKNDEEVFQHHRPDWIEVFNWLGIDVEDLGEYDAEDFGGGEFPHTRTEFLRQAEAINRKNEELLEKRIEIRRLQARIAELEAS